MLHEERCRPNRDRLPLAFAAARGGGGRLQWRFLPAGAPRLPGGDDATASRAASAAVTRAGARRSTRQHPAGPQPHLHAGGPRRARCAAALGPRGLRTPAAVPAPGADLPHWPRARHRQQRRFVLDLAAAAPAADHRLLPARPLRPVRGPQPPADPGRLDAGTPGPGQLPNRRFPRRALPVAGRPPRDPHPAQG